MLGREGMLDAGEREEDEIGIVTESFFLGRGNEEEGCILHFL